jgi:hypothetical protein
MQASIKYILFHIGQQDLPKTSYPRWAKVFDNLGATAGLSSSVFAVGHTPHCWTNQQNAWVQALTPQTATARFSTIRQTFAYTT